MEKQRPTLVPRANLIFTPEEVELMLKCSAHHYDGLCKSFSREGGLLVKMKNRFSWAEEGELPVHELFFREVDTLAKITENRFPGQEKEIFALHFSLMTVLQDLNYEAVRVNQ